MAAPLVSVIVLTYNQEKSIDRTLASVVGQKCNFDFEVVIGEDGSTDSTREICLKYVRRYPSMVRLMPEAPNKGLVKNYFDCLAACRGKYIADCAGDDFWCAEDKLQCQADFLEQHPEVAVASGDWVIDGKVHQAKELPTAVDFLTAEQELPMQLSASLYRADMLRKHLAKPGQVVCREDFGCEDLPSALALLQEGEIRRVPGAVLNYYCGEGTVSTPTSAERAWKFHYSTLYARLVLMHTYGIDDEKVKRVLAHRVTHLAKLTFRLGDSDRLMKLHSLPQFASLPLEAGAKLRFKIMSHLTLWRAMRRILLIVKR